MLVKVDFQNAFNNIRRDHILHSVKESYPEMYPFVWQAYEKSSNLFYGDYIIHSSSGLQQGDPLGPFLFALGIQPLISQLKSKLNTWYVDDGAVADEPSIVKEDLITIIREGSKIGLILNTGKCELFINEQDPQSVEKILDDFKEIAQDIRHIDDSTLVLLGAPILENSYDSILTLLLLTPDSD